MTKKVLFVCHGNICRSPMAESIFTGLAADAGMADAFEIDSAAVSTEEIGNDLYPPAKAELRRRGVTIVPHRARQITRRDYEHFDLIVAMDHSNVRWLKRLLGGDPQGKVRLLMDFTGRGGEVSDPWYTDRFDVAFDDIEEGCRALLASLRA